MIKLKDDTKESSIARRTAPRASDSTDASISAPASLGNSDRLRATAGGEPESIERRSDARVEAPDQHNAEHGDRDQAGDARDRVVHARCDARVLRLDRAMAVVVSGATTIAMPSPRTAIAGKNVVQ